VGWQSPTQVALVRTWFTTGFARRAAGRIRDDRDRASVHPREVVKEALRLNAAAVILCHPHPSGIAEPSQADELSTRRLVEALRLVDIRVLDHLIIAGSEVVSFAERGLL